MALNECDRGLSILLNDPLLLAFKADILLILDKPEEAKITIETLLKENPESSDGYERLGFYERIVTGNAKKAKEALKKSIHLDGLNDEAIAKLADLLREQGYFPEALKLIEHALSIAPWNAMHHYNYGRLLADINKIDRARIEFKKTLELDSTFSRAYLGEGILLLKEGKTDEALRELSKASLLEPNVAEIHNFLAIAYYQKREIKAALDELKRAEECDPFDSTPHQLASVVYSDLYMPGKAIEEAQKVLSLLPYRKSSGEALLESTKSGTMSVNYGLNFFDLPEWALYYAQKALFLNPYSNNSHIGVAVAYSKLGEVSALQGSNEFMTSSSSEILQGLILNPSSLNFSNRYHTLIRKPGHYLTVGGVYARGNSEEPRVDVADIEAKGDFGSRFPLTYWFTASGNRDSGLLEHSKLKNASFNLVLGYKPNYEHDIYLDLSSYKTKAEVPLIASKWYKYFDLPFWWPDDNQKFKKDAHWVQLGYHKRFNPTSHLMIGLRYMKGHYKIENPDIENDLSGFDRDRSEIQNIALGVRHLINLFNDHQLSFGMDYNSVKINSDEDWPFLYPFWIEQNQFSVKRDSLIFHLYDRWAISPKITLDAGLFLSSYKTKGDFHSENTLLGSYDLELFDKKTLKLNPRIGVAIELGKQGILRVAYQKRATTGFSGELAPVGTSGLIPPTFDIVFNQASDVQGSIEYELLKGTFIKALIGYQSLFDLASKNKAQLQYGRIAINQMLGRYFSFSARYHYNDSKYRDGSGRELPGIPKTSGDARLVFIHPNQIYLWLRESYVGDKFADSANNIKVKGYFLTDFYAQKEFLNKRTLLSFMVTNIFDKKYKSISSTYYWYNAPLTSKGRTFSFRIEYRL